ncbi:oxygenase MpaB family protein [Pokkaliibacter sp. CJK22405]|uniref:oxygenase MpaB family protein n=1 Tax=Pokkaliibacter sp. CJK22405 TaxID=3384615 RepID=UPI003985562A
MRRFIEQRVIGMTGLVLKGVDYDQPLGDPGLYGPHSQVWRVHSDFTCMLCGGVAALLLQMMHPLTLAGVWDHSNFREDMIGRLRRTGQFIAATSFASEPQAQAIVDKVRGIHDRIEGIAADGRHYRANDPALLTWVHVAEVRSFLHAYCRYKHPLTREEQDTYYREVALNARMLGAENVPESVDEVEAYMAAMRSELLVDDRVREVRDLLRSSYLGSKAMLPVLRLFMYAAADLLPRWAAQELELDLHRPQRIAVRGSVKTVASVLRWAVRDSAAMRSRKRMGLPPTRVD